MKKSIVLATGLVLMMSVVSGCGAKAADTAADAQAVEAEATTDVADEVISNDDFSMSYVPSDFFAFDDYENGSVQFSYCKEGVETAGSNVIIVTKEQDSKVDDIAKIIAESIGISSDEITDGVLGEQLIPAKIIYEETAPSEDSGLKLIDTRQLVQCGDDVIIIEIIRTPGPDEEVEMAVEGAFVHTLESFVLNR